jgi:hypothetical protein
MKTKYEQPQQIGHIVNEVLSEKGYLTYCQEYSIVSKWPSIAEKGLASASTCERVENGVIYVKVSSSPWRNEAIFHKEELIRRIKESFGCPTIKDIIFY